LGAPGVIGVIQATETIGLLTGIGQPLIGRFLIYDALNMKFRAAGAEGSDCPVCGTIRPSPSSSTTTSSAALSGAGPRGRSDRECNRDHPGRAEEEADAGETPFIPSGCASPTSTRSTIPARRSSRWASCRAATRSAEDRQIVAQCKMGGRSAKAQDFLKTVGFTTRPELLKGGFWSGSTRSIPAS
jgi:adenylyltransferase/sulfurtransferase